MESVKGKGRTWYPELLEDDVLVAPSMEKQEEASGNQNQGQRTELHVRFVLLLIVQHHNSLLKHLILATGCVGILLMNKSLFLVSKDIAKF